MSVVMLRYAQSLSPHLVVLFLCGLITVPFGTTIRGSGLPKLRAKTTWRLAAWLRELPALAHIIQKRQCDYVDSLEA